MSSWSSYSQIFNLGHKAISDLLSVPVNVEEKIDGSQFSFGLVETNLDDSGNPVDTVSSVWKDKAYSLKIRSKGAVMHIDAPERMFDQAAATVRELHMMGLLHPGWTYRSEYLAKPKHNALAYDRVPKGNLILFDVSVGDQEFLEYESKVREAERLGLEVVPKLFTGRLESVGQFRPFLETQSVLGGQKIEGVVIKPADYNLFGIDKKVLMGKFVSESFREVHKHAWKESNPSNKDIIQRICEDYCTPARWNKAIQHLREAGRIEDDVRDIGLIMQEVPVDVLKECEDEIKERLFKYAWPHIRRGLTAGLPAWYKELLLKQAFEKAPDAHLGSVADDC